MCGQRDLMLGPVTGPHGGATSGIRGCVGVSKLQLRRALRYEGNGRRVLWVRQRILQEDGQGPSRLRPWGRTGPSRVFLQFLGGGGSDARVRNHM